MSNFFQIEDDLDEVDIEINKVDQQINVLSEYQPRKKRREFKMIENFKYKSLDFIIKEIFLTGLILVSGLMYIQW